VIDPTLTQLDGTEQQPCVALLCFLEFRGERGEAQAGVREPFDAEFLREGKQLFKGRFSVAEAGSERDPLALKRVDSVGSDMHLRAHAFDGGEVRRHQGSLLIEGEAQEALKCVFLVKKDGEHGRERECGFGHGYSAMKPAFAKRRSAISRALEA